MKLFNCSVRLAGNVHHTVPKVGCTESEIIVLRHLHGNDSVISIKSAGQDKDRTKRAELMRLAGQYGKETIESLFKVPLDLDTVVVETEDDEQVVISDKPDELLGEGKKAE